MRHHCFDHSDFFCIQLAAIPSPHNTENPVASALQRDVEMRHETLAIAYQFNDFRSKEVGFYGRYPESFNSGNFIKFTAEFEEIGIATLSFTGLTEIAEIYASQHDFFHSLFCKLPGLLHHILNAVAAAFAAG